MSTRRNVVLSASGQWFAASSLFFTSLVISRLLKPAEIGVFSVTAAFVGMAQAFQSFGVTEYIVQAKNLTVQNRRSAFGTALLTGWSTAFVLMLASASIAEFYRTPEMAQIVRILALNICVTVWISPAMIMMLRERMFGQLAFMQITTSLTQAGTAITLAYWGWSSLSLALAMSASTLMQALLSTYFGRQFVLFRPSFADTRKLLRFGAQVVGANAVYQGYTQSAELVIGSWLGMASAALYSRANSIGAMYSMIVTRAVDPVMTTQFAATRRADGDLADPFRLASRYLSAVGFTLFGFLAIFASALLPLLYGPQWSASAPIMTVLSLGNLFWPLISPSGSLFIALGRPDIFLKIRSALLVARLVLMAVAAPFGLTWVAVSVAATNCADFALCLMNAHREARFAFAAYLRDVLSSAAVALVALAPAAAWACVAWQWGLQPLQTVAPGGVLAAGSWLLGTCLLKHPLWTEVRKLLPWGAKPADGVPDAPSMTAGQS